MSPDITIKDGRCWWCGAPADSREHRLKASDLVREYGKPPYTNLRTLTRFSGANRYEFQGPKSSLVKFSATLCMGCNNARSQPFDVAWDIFGAYIAEHEEQILTAEAIDWADIFGTDWKLRGADWERYVLKHAICRIIDEGQGPITLAGEFIDFLDGGQRPSSLEVDLITDSGIVEMLRLTRAAPDPDEPEAAEAGFLGTTPLWIQQDTSTGAWWEPQAGLYYRFVGVFWRIGAASNTPFASAVYPLPEGDDFFGPEFRAALKAGRNPGAEADGE